MSGDEELKKAERIALRMLTFRPRSKKEVEDRLVQKGFNLSVITNLMVLLADYGYLNDHTFANALALHLFEIKGFGFTRIGATLKARGVPPELVKETIFHLKENHSEEKTALQILKRRFSNFNAYNATLTEKNRLIQFFRRRGFTWETISRVLRMD